VQKALGIYLVRQRHRSALGQIAQSLFQNVSVAQNMDCDGNAAATG
jgi:hypothetical protein